MQLYSLSYEKKVFIKLSRLQQSHKISKSMSDSKHSETHHKQSQISSIFAFSKALKCETPLTLCITHINIKYIHLKPIPLKVKRHSDEAHEH